MAEIKQEIRQLTIRKQILYILIFSLVTVMVWVGASLVMSQKKTTIDAELTRLARSLNPTIDEGVLLELKNKRSYTAAELSNFVIYKKALSEDGRQEIIVTLDQQQ